MEAPTLVVSALTALEVAAAWLPLVPGLSRRGCAPGGYRRGVRSDSLGLR